MSRKAARVAFLLSVAAGASLLSLHPVVVRAGWPLSHEGLDVFYRTLVYSDAMRALDLFPLWDPRAHGGLGSPMPALYHKLFYLASGQFHLLTGSLKWATVLTLVLFGTVAIGGIYRIGRINGLPQTESLLIGLLFPFLNYVVNDWLVRGALSEYAALCLIPWVLVGVLRLLRSDRFPLWMAPLLALLFLAHSVIALFALPLLVLAVAVWWSRPSSNRGSTLARIATSALIALALVAPFVWSIWTFARTTQTAGWGIYHPVEEFRPLASYLWDRGYRWGERNEVIVQLDQALLITVAAGLLLLVARSRSGQRDTPDRERADLAIWIFTAGAAAVFVFLQTPWSGFVYESVPGARYLQFPWRLRSFVDSLLLLAATMLARVWWRTHPGAVRASACGVLLLTAGPHLLRDAGDVGYSIERVEAPPHRPLSEYQPAWPGGTGPERLRQLDVWAESGASASGCAPPRRLDFEVAYLVRSWGIADCPAGTPIILPLFWSGQEAVRVYEKETGSPASAYRTETDPRLHMDLSGGVDSIAVFLPTWPRILFGPRRDR